MSLISLVCGIFVTFLSYRIHPLKINQTRGIFGLFFMIALPFLVNSLTNATQLFLIQASILVMILNDLPSVPVFFRSFPLYKRFTFASILWAVSRALMYVITSFGLVFLGSYFGHFGLWIITLPTACAFLVGINHFKKLERKNRLYNPRKSS